MLQVILAIMLSLQAAQQASKPLERLSVLVGTWKGEGTGTPGDSTGEFSFEWSLNRNVLVRKSFAEYPAANGRPASRHDDLTIVFAEGERLRADYFDTEDHVIHYAVSVAPNDKSIEFLSDSVPGAPRYRLTYTMLDRPDSLKLKFEIANPDKPNSFVSYIDATLHRVR